MQHGEFRALRRFPALDGLRGIAALLVVAFHFAGPKYAFLSGWLGVQLFFVLSGFLITTLALREEERNGRISFRDFYVRRTFRIMPVYLAVIGIHLVFDWLRGTYATGLGPHIGWYLTFNVEWMPGEPDLGQAWTLGIEEKFYLLWPLLAFGAGAMVLRRRLGRVGVVAVVLVALLLAGVTDAVYYAEIMLGAVLALVMHSPVSYRAVRWLSSPIAGVVAAVAAVGVMLAAPRIELATGGVFAASALFSVCVALMLPSLLRPSPVARLLSSRPLAWVGQRSYALYLVQHVAAMVVAALVPQLSYPRLGMFLATAFVGLAIADLLGRWVEQPFIALGRRFLTRRPAPAAAEVPQLATGASVRPAQLAPPQQVAPLVGRPPVPAVGRRSQRVPDLGPVPATNELQVLPVPRRQLPAVPSEVGRDVRV